LSSTPRPDDDEQGYTRRARHRFLALTFYLTRVPALGHEAAAAMTCERFGHEGFRGRCERCGVPIISR
jgi:hypothetical protein